MNLQQQQKVIISSVHVGKNAKAGKVSRCINDPAKRTIVFQQNCKMTTELNNGENDTDEEQTIIDNEDNHASSQHGNTTTEFPAMKKGIKLPKTDSQWQEVNLFFKININNPELITDLNSYTEYFQSMIYNYFADNFGTVDVDSSDYRDKYSTLSDARN